MEMVPWLPARSRLSVNLSAPLLVDAAHRRDLRRLRHPGPPDRRGDGGHPRAPRRGDRQHARGLRERGVRFAVDDVGAGYSGLSQLAALRPTYLKLDRALVRGIDQDPGRMALMRSLADYANATGGPAGGRGRGDPGGARPRARRRRRTGAGLPARPAGPALAARERGRPRGAARGRPRRRAGQLRASLSSPCSAAIRSSSAGSPAMIVRACSVTSSTGQSHQAARSSVSTPPSS